MAEPTRIATRPIAAGPVAPLAEREELRGLRATIELAPIGIAHFATDGRFLLANDCLCEMLGCRRDELLAKTFQEITFPDDLDACLALNAEVATGARSSYELEKRFVRQDGRIIWARVTVSAARDQHGAVSFFIGVAADTTEQHAAEAARRESEQQFRTLANAISQMAWISDRAGNRRWYNDRWYEYTGLTFEDLKDLGWQRVHHPAYIDEVLARQRKCIEQAAVWEDTFPIRGRDGKFRWFLTRAVPVRGEQGEVVAYFGTNTDITERRDAELERERVLELERMQREKAERATLVRDEMVAIVAHDLRNPVHTITMAAHAALSGSALPPQAERLTRIIQRTSSGMETLLNDLLDISRIEARTFATARKLVDLQVLLNEARDLLEPHAREKQVTLTVTAPPSHLSVMGDAPRLMQVLSNLVGNALKFTAPGGQVAVDVRVRETQVEISVVDDGPGVPHEHLAHIFDRFWQADRTSRIGAGLGLPIAKGIVEAHGGRIWAESSPGHGMTMRFSLPLE